MAKALFVCGYKNGQVVLPPFVSESGSIQLAEIVSGNVRDGCGWTCIGNVPYADSCIVLVDSSAATIAAMKADANYIFLETADET